MDEQRLDDQLEPIYNLSICADTGCDLEDLSGATETGDRRGSGKSMLTAQHDD